MRRYEEIAEEIRRRKAERWARILASEPPGRPAGRRPRDPEKEELLLRLDRARLARRESEGDLRITRTPGARPPVR